MMNFITHALLIISWFAYLALIVLKGDSSIGTLIFRIILGALIGFCFGNSLSEALK